MFAAPLGFRCSFDVRWHRDLRGSIGFRWSPDGDKAVLWSKENGTYFLYIYDNSASPPLKLLQSGGRYGDWISNDTVLFRYASSDAMYKKAITEDSGADPILFYDAPWAQLQPRQ